MKERKTYLILGLVLCTLVISCCTTFQTPKVLEKGEQSLTIGAAATVSSELWNEFSASYRYGISNRMDVGVQIPTNWVNASIITDIKYQILTQPFYLAASVGTGIYHGDHFRSAFLVFPTMLIGGTESFYIGVKSTFSKVDTTDYDEEDGMKRYFSYGPTGRYPIAGGVFTGYVFNTTEQKAFILEGGWGWRDLVAVWNEETGEVYAEFKDNFLYYLGIARRWTK